MIHYFYSYIKNIILFLIFMSFIQVILPSNKHRSYINLVFGMILIFIMIKPLNLLFFSIKNYEILPIFNENEIVINYDLDIKNYEDIQNKMIKNAFKENVKLQIETSLKNNYIIKDIDIDLYENKYSEINIDKIHVTLKNNNKNIYVKPFNEDKGIKDLENKEIINLKNLINKIYNIDVNNIYITLT